MNKKIMILILTILLFFTSQKVISASLIQALPATQAYLGNHPDVVLKSKLGGCHPKDSLYRSSISLTFDNNGNPTNSYPDVFSCISDGGSFPEEELVKVDPYVKHELAKKSSIDKTNTEFAGFNWGAGFAFIGMDEESIKDVSIEDGVISINHSGKKSGVLLVESHYYWTFSKDDSYGFGPYVAIGVIGENGVNPLSNYGGGIMFGGKQIGSQSWNIGFGVYVDTETVRLREQFTDGMITTITDPQRLTYKTDATGWMIMFSANF
ncbi:hypothetical protein [uncultured Psychrosphaera sp.]|jgi:hypothetical protein|uniref:hypothetical protein n=1 Tax=uncultured Psychrosphaera sp. TaxID=1403522 RepID=UPI00263832CD|nr:hypothetical protein [uncultured Psychrosphaera sp.]